MWMCVCCIDSNISSVVYFGKLEEAEKFVCCKNEEGVKRMEKEGETIVERIGYRKSPFFIDNDYSLYTRKTEKQLYPKFFVGVKSIDENGKKHYCRWLVCGCRIYENAEEAIKRES